ncbi:MAG TPA: hypothetical protein VK589_24615 [Chryseolinea sp.]|nr:hypothetical protein [Chryseolinea sp.]
MADICTDPSGRSFAHRSAGFNFVRKALPLARVFDKEAVALDDSTKEEDLKYTIEFNNTILT